jgi:NAD(P)-dependent dehydrogenase (short-subunit alcohol dehydrogenase family)
MPADRQRPDDSEFRMPSFRLDGRVALVTGGSRGLGLAIALALAEYGADVAVVARGAAEVAAAQAAIQARGRRGLGIVTDIGAPGAPDLLVDRTVTGLGRLDILVNGAGINIRKPAASFTREDFAGLFRINLEAAFFISQAAGAVMRQQRWGRILTIGSIAAEVAIPNVSVYAMSKGGLRQMVKSLALEWARDGVTVNGIAPGRFWTRMTDAVFSDDRLYDSAVRVIPMGRPGLPTDLAGAAVLLASEAGAYITGQTLVIDGGWLASGGVEG